MVAEYGDANDPNLSLTQTAFQTVIAAAVKRVNDKLNNIERVRRFHLIPESFTTDNEMMTPSMKIRRHVINERYGADLERLYGG